MEAVSSLRIALMPAASFLATTTLAPVDQKLRRYRELVVTWNVTAADEGSANETYDLYITTSDGVSSWDLCHFPQVATTGAKTFTARIAADLIPQTVAANGTATNEGTLLTSSTNAVGTLAAGTVRHGKWGDFIGYSLVIAGTITTGIACSMQVEAR